ncbi:MAG: SPOR domain-containing protein [Bacteroidales bacterium]|nr:SPOR domain-containing protein [Bacteroidales bacterium]
MKRVLVILVLLFTAAAAGAQDFTDSLNVQAAVDSTLRGKDILNIIQTPSGDVYIRQSDAVRNAFRKYVSNNASRSISGYRIRVYYDNEQRARAKSESIARAVAGRYPGVKVYRTFESPNFKVSVGDFRTKDEALRLFNELKILYPTAFIIKENINYPLIDADAIFN